jgi:hypothetical protein
MASECTPMAANIFFPYPVNLEIKMLDYNSVKQLMKVVFTSHL